MPKKQDNKKILIIIGVIVLVIFLFKGQTFTGAVTCVSNEPTDVIGFYNKLFDEGYTIEDVQLEEVCPDQNFPTACSGPSFFAYKDNIRYVIIGFPTFMDGPDITIDNCYDFLYMKTKAICSIGEPPIYKNDCDECDTYCSFDDNLLGQPILQHSEYRYYYANPLPSEEYPVSTAFICSSNNKVGIMTTDKVQYENDFYICQEEPTEPCKLDCEWYEQCNKAKDDCKIATWVYIVGGLLIFFMIFSKL